MDHAAIMNSCSAKGERVGLANLSATERVVVLSPAPQTHLAPGVDDASECRHGLVSVPSSAALLQLAQGGLGR